MLCDICLHWCYCKYIYGIWRTLGIIRRLGYALLVTRWPEKVRDCSPFTDTKCIRILERNLTWSFNSDAHLRGSFDYHNCVTWYYRGICLLLVGSIGCKEKVISVLSWLSLVSCSSDGNLRFHEYLPSNGKYLSIPIVWRVNDVLWLCHLWFPINHRGKV